MQPGGHFRASKVTQSRRGERKNGAPPGPPLLLCGCASGCFVWRLWLLRVSLNFRLRGRNPSQNRRIGHLPGSQQPHGGNYLLLLRPNFLSRRLQDNSQRSSCGDFAADSFRASGNSGNPLQPEPPRIAAATTTSQGQEGVRGEARFRFPPASLRRFRRAKAASKQHIPLASKRKIRYNRLNTQIRFSGGKP